MHRLVSKEIEQYCEAHSTKENELLYDLHRQTYLKTDLPIMLSGHLQGNFFQFLVVLYIKSKKIVIKPETLCKRVYCNKNPYEL